MSAPHTNIEKQKKRHRAPLWGIGVVAVFGVALILFWISTLISGDEATPAPEAPAAVEGPAAETPATPDAGATEGQ